MSDEFQTVEIRSEEEFTGNILWLSCQKELVDFDAALMSLWIEAQEYSSEYNESEKLSDYRREEKLFLYEEMSVDQCTNKVNQYLDKVYSRRLDESFVITLDGKIVDHISFPSITADSIVKVLECNSTDFSVFIIGARKYMLFCWTDVA